MFLFFQPEQFPQVVHSFVVLAVKGFIFADCYLQSLVVCFHSWSVVGEFRPLLCKMFLPTPQELQRQHQFRVRRGRICPRDFRVGVCENAYTETCSAMTKSPTWLCGLSCPLTLQKTSKPSWASFASLKALKNGLKGIFFSSFVVWADITALNSSRVNFPTICNF